jgi:nonsense-mediated mRNA decay protein 3
MKSCPRCGKPESDFAEPFLGAFCPDCFSSKSELFEVKPPLELERCQKCGKARITGEWVYPSAERIGEYLSAKIRSSHKFKLTDCKLAVDDPSQLQATIRLEFVLPQGSTAEKKTTRTIALLPTMCTGCSQKSGGYFEAIIQLRGDPEKIARKAALIKAMIGNDSFVAKVEELKEGLDIYVGSFRSATNVLSRLKLSYTQANKLAGKKRGKNLYRRSYCVRLE